MKRNAARIVATGMLAAASLTLGVAPAQAALPQAAPHKPLATVAILPAVHLANGWVSVKLRITCDPVPGIQWEGDLGAVQGDIFGDTGLDTGRALDSSICDGRSHVEKIGVVPNDSRLSFGPGSLTLNVYIYDENTLDLYATDTRTVTLR